MLRLKNCLSIPFICFLPDSFSGNKEAPSDITGSSFSVSDTSFLSRLSLFSFEELPFADFDFLSRADLLFLERDFLSFSLPSSCYIQDNENILNMSSCK